MVATGSGDVPRAILRWGQSKGWDLRVVTGIDLHARTIGESAKSGGSKRVTFVRGDALRLPFADVAFDYAITSLFLHHLDEEQIVAVLRRG